MLMYRGWPAPFLGLFLGLHSEEKRRQVRADFVRVVPAEVLLQGVYPGELLLTDGTTKGRLDDV